MTNILSRAPTIRLAILASFALFCVAQDVPDMEPRPPGHSGISEADKRLQEQIVKDDAKKNTQDADKLVAMALELKAEVAKSSGQVISVKASKDAREIKKLAKSIRGRLSRDYKDIRFAPLGQPE